MVSQQGILLLLCSARTALVIEVSQTLQTQPSDLTGRWIMEEECVHYLPSKLLGRLNSDGRLVVVLGIAMVTKLQRCQTSEDMGGVVMLVQA